MYSKISLTIFCLYFTFTFFQTTFNLHVFVLRFEKQLSETCSLLEIAVNMHLLLCFGKKAGKQESFKYYLAFKDQI